MRCTCSGRREGVVTHRPGTPCPASPGPPAALLPLLRASGCPTNLMSATAGPMGALHTETARLCRLLSAQCRSPDAKAVPELRQGSQTEGRAECARLGAPGRCRAGGPARHAERAQLGAGCRCRPALGHGVWEHKCSCTKTIMSVGGDEGRMHVAACRCRAPPLPPRKPRAMLQAGCARSRNRFAPVSTADGVYAWSEAFSPLMKWAQVAKGRSLVVGAAHKRVPGSEGIATGGREG